MADLADPALFTPAGRIAVECFTPSALVALQQSLVLTRRTRWEVVRSPHLFMGLLASPDEAIRGWASRWQADPGELLDQFRDLFLQTPGVVEAPLALTREFFSDNVLRLLRHAWRRSHSRGADRVSTTDLLVSLLTAPDSIVAECFERIGLLPARLAELAQLAEQSDPS